MFSLLNPLSLWLGAALAVPLAIHFLGRQRLKKIPFPSLLLVRERFSKSMHRHRLKNLLLLIIRTLLILCLLLALANPALQSAKSAASHPDISIALIHNGIYGRLLEKDGNDILKGQRLRLHILDSATGSRTQSLPLIGDGSGIQEVSDRFGDYGEAVTRLSAALGSRPGTAEIRIPVFAWEDLVPARESLARALKENPGLQITFIDYGEAGAKARAFTGLKTIPASDAPTVKLSAAIHPAAPSGSAGKVQVFLNGRLFQETASDGGRVEVTLPLGEGPRTLGKLSMPGGGFAAADYHFCFPDAGEWVMAHAGSVLASLPSLGRETYFRRIIHVASGKDIPWSGVMGNSGTAGKTPRAAIGAPVASAASRPTGLKLVYFANERGVDPATYARAVEFVKQGGRLIIGVGQESDVPMLNRFLLQPLRLGRLGNLVEAPSSAPVSLDRAALSGLGRLPPDLGAMGTVRKRFAFLPDSGTDVLLYQSGTTGEGESPAKPGEGPTRENGILVERDFYRGKVLLWTTDLDDLNWSDLGVSPITPLLHQALQETGSEERAHNLSVASDSIFTLALPSDASDVGAGSGESALHPDVRDPDGRAFTKVRLDGHRLHIGPFDRLGIHRIILGGDTSAFAVNLASATAETRGDKDAILEGFAAFKGRVAVVSEEAPPVAHTAVRAMWPALFLASILLLFLEGLIASVYSTRRSRI